MKAQKGLFLSSLIVVFGLAISIATVFLLLDQDIRNSLGDFPGWFSSYLLISLLGRLGALYVIWNLRRWGVYLLLFFECLEISMGLFVFTGVFTIPMRAFVGVPLFLAVLLIWFLALRPKWQLYQ